MGDFYGYDPGRFVQKDKYGIGAASQIAGQTIAAIPGLQKEKKEYEYLQEQRKLAIEIAEKDWTSMDTAWKSLKNTYTRQAQPLLDGGQMTVDEFRSNINQLRAPTQADKKDPGSYIDNLGKNYGTLIGEVKTRIRSQGRTQTVTGAMEGAPPQQATVPAGRETAIPMQEPQMMGTQVPPGQLEAQPQPAQGGFTEQPVTQQTIPGTPPAQTKEQISAVAGREGYTTQEMMEDPRFATAPTGMQQEKEKRLGEKEKRLQDLTSYQEAMMQYRWATLQYKKTKDKKTLALAEDNLKKAYVPYKARLDTDMMKLNQELKDLKAGEEDAFTGETTTDWDAIRQKQMEILGIQRQIDDLEAEKKMAGAIPGETRKFSPEGRETERIIGPETPKIKGTGF